jgi:hypothetical protein
MTGKVYIANVSASAATYSVNNAIIRTLGRPMNPSSHTPYFVLVGRSRYPDSSGSFANATNAFTVDFADSIPPEPVRTAYQVAIPPSMSTDDDLILYVFRDAVYLMTARGQPVGDRSTAGTGG